MKNVFRALLPATLILLFSAASTAESVTTPKLGDADFPKPSPGARHDKKVAAVKAGDYDLVLIGDSITHSMGELGGKYSPMKEVWQRHFAPRKAINLGFNGYRTEQIAVVPVTWDETIPLAGKIGEYVAIARRKGDDWYIGALNNWTERELKIDLSFLGESNYQGTLFLDGMNAHRMAEDYRVEERTFKSSTPLSVLLKPGGGTAIVLKKR